MVITGAYKVADAGDVNGDGQADVLVARGDIAMTPTRGRTWILFGPLSHDVDLAALDPTEGFVIEGAEPGDYASQAAGAGDVNGDGLDDIVVGAPGVCNPAGCPGRAYVVFGKSSGSPVELSKMAGDAPSNDGYRIDGAGDGLGWDVSGAGDVNADGLADVLISAPFDGAFYLVFGKAGSEPVNLATFDTGSQGLAGYRVTAPSAERNEYYAVANAGDVNGDGRPDAALGVIPRGESRGSAYIVFGKVDPAPVDLSMLGVNGYEMRGPFRGSSAGFSVVNAGDFNDDGLSDTLVTAPAVNDAGDGPSYVVFGKATPETIDLRHLGTSGIKIDGGERPQNFGRAASGGADVSGDGVPDVMIGAPYRSPRGRYRAGSTYVVYGNADDGRIDVDRPGFGFRIEGAHGRDCPPQRECAGDFAGEYTAILGDVGGDEVHDIGVGAKFAGPGPYRVGGKVYVVLSSEPRRSSATSATRKQERGPDRRGRVLDVRVLRSLDLLPEVQPDRTIVGRGLGVAHACDALREGLTRRRNVDADGILGDFIDVGVDGHVRVIGDAVTLQVQREACGAVDR